MDVLLGFVFGWLPSVTFAFAYVYGFGETLDKVKALVSRKGGIN